MGLSKPVYIHGWGFSSKVFASLEGIKPDLPAHGGNTSDYLGFEELVEQLALSLHSRHDLIGWSMGGSVAMLLALRFPRKVKRLFLIGATPFFGGAWSQKNIRAFKVRINRHGVEEFRRSALGRDFQDSFDVKEGMKLLEDYISMDLRSLLPYLHCPVFILHGTEDKVVPLREAFKLHALIKGSKLITLPGGHFPAGDEKSLLSEILKVC